MKCINCQGTGLKDLNNVCSECNGFGVSKDSISSSRPEVDVVINKEIEKPKVKKSLISKFKSKRK